MKAIKVATELGIGKGEESHKMDVSITGVEGWGQLPVAKPPGDSETLSSLAVATIGSL
jgi:hypothetical protein